MDQFEEFAEGLTSAMQKRKHSGRILLLITLICNLVHFNRSSTYFQNRNADCHRVDSQEADVSVFSRVLAQGGEQPGSSTGTSSLLNTTSAGAAVVITTTDRLTAGPTVSPTAMPTSAPLPKYTLVIVRCKGNLTYLDDDMNAVPSHLQDNKWRIIIYNKCNHIAPPLSPALQQRIEAQYNPINAGAEECNGYIDYMYDYYYNLTEITVFMHDDALAGWSKHKGPHAHTPFDTFRELANAVDDYLTPEHPFLHLGVSELFSVWGEMPYVSEAMKIVWPYYKAITGELPPKSVTFKPGGHMAIRKEALQRYPRDTYFALLQQVRHGGKVGKKYPDARRFCCTMEVTWHLFFGLPPIMPKRAMASDLTNHTQCKICHKPEQANFDHRI